MPIVVLTSVGAYYVLARSAVAVSCPADTTEDTLATIAVPANAMGANGLVRLTTHWSMTSSANNKTGRVRLGGTSGTAHQSAVWTTTAAARLKGEVANRGAVNSQVGGQESLTTAAGVTAVVTTSAIDTSVATSLVITGQKASSGETLTLESYLVELFQ